MVDSNGNFGKARAERAVGEEPVCDCEGGCIVGWLLAIVGREEAEEGEDGGCHCLVWFVVAGKDEKEESKGERRE